MAGAVWFRIPPKILPRPITSSEPAIGCISHDIHGRIRTRCIGANSSGPPPPFMAPIQKGCNPLDPYGSTLLGGRLKGCIWFNPGWNPPAAARGRNRRPPIDRGKGLADYDCQTAFTGP